MIDLGFLRYRTRNELRWDETRQIKISLAKEETIQFPLEKSPFHNNLNMIVPLEDRRIRLAVEEPPPAYNRRCFTSIPRKTLNKMYIVFLLEFGKPDVKMLLSYPIYNNIIVFKCPEYCNISNPANLYRVSIKFF